MTPERETELRIEWVREHMSIKPQITPWLFRDPRTAPDSFFSDREKADRVQPCNALPYDVICCDQGGPWKHHITLPDGEIRDLNGWNVGAVYDYEARNLGPFWDNLAIEDHEGKPEFTAFWLREYFQITRRQAEILKELYEHKN